mmetsp:Transcript_5717/g.11356  ORF Transcript_5717/g.11356 Transcript_5717/m.11356 type:complete len:267 (+) Transcript_5717:428-1228(+)
MPKHEHQPPSLGHSSLYALWGGDLLGDRVVFLVLFLLCVFLCSFFIAPFFFGDGGSFSLDHCPGLWCMFLSRWCFAFQSSDRAFGGAGSPLSAISISSTVTSGSSFFAFFSASISSGRSEAFLRDPPETSMSGFLLSHEGAVSSGAMPGPRREHCGVSVGVAVDIVPSEGPKPLPRPSTFSVGRVDNEAGGTPPFFSAGRWGVDVGAASSFIDSLFASRWPTFFFATELSFAAAGSLGRAMLAIITGAASPSFSRPGSAPWGSVFL